MMNADPPPAAPANRLRLWRRVGAGTLAVLLCAALVGAQVDRMPDGRFLIWPSERPPRPLPAREVKFPPYEVRTLANGMQVIAVLHHEQPAVSMRLLVRAGSVQDPPGKVGIASLAAALLDQGTTTKSAEQIADEIDFIGGALGTGSGSDLTFVNVIVMKDSFGVGMDMLADVVRNPAFAPAEIERQKQQAISSLQVSGNDPDYVADVLFERLVYGFHPYGLPNTGTPETLAGITRADLQEYHRRYFVPNNMILAIVGDVTGEEAFAAAERVFGAWPRAEVPAVSLMDPPPPTRRVVVVDKPDAVQTEIRVGQLAIPRKHDDYMAYDLAVKILGGEGANRLHQVLRSARGLTYGAQADAQLRKLTGHFVAETDTRTETTGETLRLTVDEVARLQRERVSDRELADAQAYLAGSFPLTIETPNDIATQVLNVIFYELPVEEIGTFRERVQAVKPDDIQRVARQYIQVDRLSIVLVGDATTFVPQLRRVGFTDIEVIPIAQLDLMSATLRRGARASVEEPSKSFGTFGALGAFGTFGTFGKFGSFGPFGPFGPFGSFLGSDLAYTNTQVNSLSSATTKPNASNPPNFPNSPNPPNSPNSPNVPNSPNSPNQSNPPNPPNVPNPPNAPNGPNAPNAPNDPNASALLKRVIEAKGGLDALKKIRTVVAESDTTFHMGDQPLVSQTRTYVLYPDKFRVDATVAGAQVVQVYNGGQAWAKDPAGVHDAPPGMRADFAASVRRDIIPLLVDAADGKLAVRMLPDEGSDGRVLKVVEVSGAGLLPVKLYIDNQSLIVRQSFQTPGPDGRPIGADEMFSDYRNVDGVQVPFQAEVRRDGDVILSRTLTKVTFNTPLDDTLFIRPR